ncbi:MAG: pyridine nucleotide-disulfide oxidoreductase [Firmicutes bacterium HGW-Firmicutes-12]|nr:MAG: pyridine nucleotide-disulfide oxidoreductase [Firmicutes bacterium HGW-Firmicutes-12]
MSQLKTLILGGGIGGIVASQVLKKALGKDMHVAVIDKDDKHHFASSYPLMLIGERTPESITRNLSNLEKKDIEFIHAEIKGIDPMKKQVKTDKGTISGDYMIISLGAEYNLKSLPGFSRYAYNIYDFAELSLVSQILPRFQEGHIVLFISSLPFKCPPAPYENIFLLDQFFRQKGLRSRVDLTLITPEPSPEPFAGPLVGQSIRKMLADRHINLITQAKVLSLEPGKLILDHTTIKGDLFLGIPSHQTSLVLRESDLVDSTGWVLVDMYTLETVYPNVYAIGDATAIKLPVIGADAPKAGIFANYQAEVVSRNIALKVRGKRPRYKYKGKGACIMNTGFGRSRYSTVHYYRKPSPFITLMRPTHSSYWGKIIFEKYWLNRWI